MMLMVVGSGNAWADNWSIDLRGLTQSDIEATVSSTETVTIGGVTL